MKAPELKPHQLSFNLLSQVCSAIQDTGFMGSAEDYVRQFYGKAFADLTVCEAEMIVQQLEIKPGCLYEGDPKELTPAPEVEHEP